MRVYVSIQHLKWISAMGKYLLSIIAPTAVRTYIHRWQECHFEWYHCWAWRAGEGNWQGLISGQLHPARLQQGQGHHLADQSEKCRLLPLRCVWGHYCGVSHHLLWWYQWVSTEEFWGPCCFRQEGGTEQRAEQLWHSGKSDCSKVKLFMCLCCIL